MTRALRIAAIRERLAAGTPGPWVCRSEDTYRDGEIIVMSIEAGEERIVETDCGVYPPRLNDAQLIAAAPSDLAYLIGEVERHRLELISAFETIQYVYRTGYALDSSELCAKSISGIREALSDEGVKT